jgi:hypothetical protein
MAVPSAFMSFQVLTSHARHLISATWRSWRRLDKLGALRAGEIGESWRMANRAESELVPDKERREKLLGTLGELIGRGGAAPFLSPPVAPGEAAFPEPWQPSRSGVAALLRRLAWHGGVTGEVTVIDDRRGRRATEKVARTQVEVHEVSDRALSFTLSIVGEDDFVGTLAHEIGVVHAMRNRNDPDPYRASAQPVLTVDGERDLERGSIAAVYLGLGVLAANAAFQQYSRDGKNNGAYIPLEYDVVHAGYLEMSELAYLVAVQAIVRGADEPPAGLSPPQRDEVGDWIEVLAGQRAALREQLGLAADAQGATRPEVKPFDDVKVTAAEPLQRRAFRWHHKRPFLGGGLGFVIGSAVGFAIINGGMPPTAFPVLVLGGFVFGFLFGRGVEVTRCSACASVVPRQAQSCAKCKATLHGDIKSLNERLAAEEALEEREHARENGGENDGKNDREKEAQAAG